MNTYRFSDFEKYGKVAALVMGYLRNEIHENVKLGRNCFGKRTWACAPIVDITDYLASIPLIIGVGKGEPGISNAQVRYAVSKLVGIGVLMESNFNRTPYDRAKWYAFRDEWKDQ